MFQLIVAVISIALVAALALASIWYGGEAFTRGQLKAQVTTMINQAQQISGANTLYKTDNGGVGAQTIGELSVASGPDAVNYLAELPVAPSKITDGEWTIDTANNAVYVQLQGGDTFTAVAKAVDEADVGETDDGAAADTKYSVPAFYFPL